MAAWAPPAVAIVAKLTAIAIAAARIEDERIVPPWVSRLDPFTLPQLGAKAQVVEGPISLEQLNS